MTAYERWVAWFNALATRFPSDGAVADALGMHRNLIAHWRKGGLPSALRDPAIAALAGISVAEVKRILDPARLERLEVVARSLAERRAARLAQWTRPPRARGGAAVGRPPRGRVNDAQESLALQPLVAKAVTTPKRRGAGRSRYLLSDMIMTFLAPTLSRLGPARPPQAA